MEKAWRRHRRQQGEGRLMGGREEGDILEFDLKFKGETMGQEQWHQNKWENLQSAFKSPTHCTIKPLPLPFYPSPPSHPPNLSYHH